MHDGENASSDDVAIVVKKNGSEQQSIIATIGIIKSTIAKDLSNEELQLFLYHSKRTGLDPLSRQIYAVSRYDNKLQRNTMTIQVSIDGFRLIAERTGKYAGQLGPFWCGEDGAWKEVWIDIKPPVAAKVGIIRTDFRKPLWSVAKWNNYYPADKQAFMWNKMPEHMLAKVAEALSLRRAFPMELSGYYTQEEMEQVSNHSNGNTNEKLSITETDLEWFVTTALPAIMDKKAKGEITSKQVMTVVKSFREGKLTRDRIEQSITTLNNDGTINNEAKQ